MHLDLRRRDLIGSFAALTAAGVMTMNGSLRHAATFVTATAAAAALSAALLASSALAHHGVSQYEMSETLTLAGVVEKWDWKSPHTWLTLAVDRNGVREIWEIEGAPPRWMTGQGWTPESLAAGESVAIMFHPLRKGSNGGILMEVERSGGEVLKVNRPARLGGP